MKHACASAVLLVISAAPALAWIPQVTEDKLDGSKTLTLWRFSADAERRPQRRSASTVRATLAIHCKRKQVRYIAFVDDELVASTLSTVAYRVGTSPPVTGRRWEVAADNTGVGSWKSATTISFLRAVAKGETLFIRVTDDVFGVTDMTFDTSGLADELKNREADCGKIF
jgi:hypothetical protein